MRNHGWILGFRSELLYTSTLLTVFPVMWASFARLNTHRSPLIHQFSLSTSSLLPDSLYSLHIQSYISCFNGALRWCDPRLIICLLYCTRALHYAYKPSESGGTRHSSWEEEIRDHHPHSAQDNWDTAETRLRYNRFGWDTAEIRLRYSGDIAETRLRYSWDMAEIQLRHGWDITDSAEI